ncbi:MAG: LamG domain-containing protein [Aquificota bacterium]
METGEIFVHLKTCPNGAVWKGQFWTTVAPSTVSKFDIFDDGSAVALWRFDGNPYDDGGIYNGTWYGTEKYDAGKFGQAAKFDGNSYINLGNLDNIFSQKSYTVTGWLINFSGTFLNIRNLEADASSNDCKGGLLWVSDGNIYFYVKGTQDNTQIETIAPYNSADIHFITIIHDSQNKTVRLLVDTNEVANISYKGDLIFNDGITGYLGVHYYKTTKDFYAAGLIDQVRIFNRALTDEEVLILYNEMEVNC